MKKFAITCLLMICFVFAGARSVKVSTAAQINGGSWQPGDTIVMLNGSWIDQTISFKANGTALQPVVLTAQTPGSVLLSGSSSLSFSGTYIEVSGLYFKDGNLSGAAVISFRTSSSATAENCRVTNTAIVNYNPNLNTVDSKWVSLYGRNNRVDHCSFENKTNSGTLLVVWLQAGIVPGHLIEENYFGYRNPNLDANGSELNGQEIIRIGDSSTSMQTASVIVRNNFFERCNGEIEIISNKSCGNLYQNNLFYECSGMLTLRHGNNCTVEGNYFFGNGISNSGGVRVIGENHKVLNNYFDNLRGTGYRAALCLVRGKENSALNEYFQVKNALVAFNTMVNCAQSFSINYNSSTTCTLPPVGTVVAHNHVYNTNSNNTNVYLALTDVAMDVTWKNNLMNLGRYLNFAYQPGQVITGQNPRMTLSATPVNMYEPSAGTDLSNFTTSEYPEVTADIRGRIRPGASKLPGSSEAEGVVTRSMPVKTEVGARFFNQPSTGLTSKFAEPVFDVFVQKNQLVTYTTVPGKLDLYSLSGQIRYRKELSSGSHWSFSPGKGVYLVSFLSLMDERLASKLIVLE